jgi:hypothetical protein
MGCQPQPSGHVRRCGRLRAFALAYAGIERIAANGADLGLLVGDLQSLEGVELHGGELGPRMRAEAHSLLRVGDPARFPVSSCRTRSLYVILTERRGHITW